MDKITLTMLVFHGFNIAFKIFPQIIPPRYNFALNFSVFIHMVNIKHLFRIERQSNL